MVNGLFIDGGNLPALQDTYSRFTGLAWTFDEAAYEQKRWIVTHLFSHPELRSPEWETWLRNAAASPPWTTNVYDYYDQLRRNVIGVMAYWKMPEALSPLLEHFDAFGPDRACELLVALGDPSALPVLEAKRAKAKRAAERASIDRAIAKLGGPPPAPVAARANAIEPAPSGRAACRGCKEKIAKGELRFGEAVKNVFAADGEPTMRWYHLRCAAQKKPGPLAAALEAHVGEVPERETLLRAAAEGLTRGKGKKKG